MYRIENGRATEYFSPGERYIWALAFAPDGSLFVATGQQGKIYRVTAAGRGEAYYETGQAHVTALAFDRAAAVSPTPSGRPTVGVATAARDDQADYPNRE